MTARDQVLAAGEIVESIRPLLAGHSPEVVGAALADLFATLLAGYHDARGKKRTTELREAVITEWLKVARALVEPNEHLLLERLRRRSN
jgi:hypothetical protein